MGRVLDDSRRYTLAMRLRGDLSLVRAAWKRSPKNRPTFQISANIGQRSRIYTITAMVFIVAVQFQEERTGLADHDAFTADVRLQTERYEQVCRRWDKSPGESARNATRAARLSASICWQFRDYRFASRRISVSPTHVTSALGLPRAFQSPVSP